MQKKELTVALVTETGSKLIPLDGEEWQKDIDRTASLRSVYIAIQLTWFGKNPLDGMEEGTGSRTTWTGDGARWSWSVQWWWMAVDCYTRLRWRRQTDTGNGVFAGLGSGILKRLFCWLAQSRAELICLSWFWDWNKNNSSTCADNHRGVVVVIVCVGGGFWLVGPCPCLFHLRQRWWPGAKSIDYRQAQNWLANSTGFGNSIVV